MPDPWDGELDEPQLPAEEVEARRRRLTVILVAAAVLVLGLFVTQRLAARTADRTAERLRAELDVLAVGVGPADVTDQLNGGDGVITAAAPLVERPEFLFHDQPTPEQVRLVFRPVGWQAGLAPRCVVLIVEPTEHQLLVRGRNCGLEPPTGREPE